MNYQQPAAKAKNNLVVDDEESVRSTLRRILEKNDYNCTTAPDAGKTMAFLKETHFDLLLCDIKMQGETGLELIEDVYNHKRLHSAS